MRKVTEVGLLNKQYIKLLGLSINEGKVLIDTAKQKYIQKHQDEFDSKEDFEFHLELMPEFISEPDYIGVHPSKNSIQFIKRTSKHILLAVRIKPNQKSPYWVKSMYPITEDKLKLYLDAKTVIKIEN